MRLDGKVAVVTGAGSGIGLATSRRFAAEGASVVCVDIDADAGKRAAAEVDGEFVSVDVADEEQVRDLFHGVVERHGGVHIAFNNAGISPADDDSILTTGIDAWDRVQRVNLTSVYLCCKYAIEPVQAQRRMVHVPMGRFGEASEIAAAVTFLASDDASFITASTFLVDGGISAAYVTPL